MTSAKTDATRSISEALETCRSRLEQDFADRTRELAVKRQERLKRLEELTRETLKTVDREWEQIRERILREASDRREMASSRLGEMLAALDREQLYRESLESAIGRILGEDEREESKP